MFFETTIEIYEKLSKKLNDIGIVFEVSDCTMPEDSTQHVHMNFGNLDNKSAILVAKIADECCGLIAEDSKKSPTNGKPISYIEKDSVDIV